MQKFLLLFLFLTLLSRSAGAAVEIQTSVLPSAALVGRADIVLSTHNTLLIGVPGAMVGPYLGYEIISTNVADSTYGAALRFGGETYFEIDGGFFQRDFHQPSGSLKGTGVAGNLVVGTYFNSHFGLDLALSYKRIQNGMDVRTIIDLLPFLALKAGF